MTKKEAIAMLKRMQEPEAWEPQINEAAFEALEMAIKALEGEDNVPDTNVGDIISRQAAIDGVKTLHDVAWKNRHEPTLSANVVLDMIRELPSAQPEKRTEERAETHACDLISRQGMCDSLNKYRIEKTLEGKDVSLVWECIDKVLQEPSAQPEQAVKDCRNCKHGKYNDYHDTYFCYNEEDCSNWDKWETSAQPEITLESAIDYLHSIGWMQDHDKQMYEMGMADADVQPVVHGEWVVSHIPDSMLWECNQCGFDCGAHSFNFCPKCGCKMDRKGADE